MNFSLKFLHFSRQRAQYALIRCVISVSVRLFPDGNLISALAAKGRFLPVLPT